MEYTKQQVIEHLRKYKTTKEAIDDIDAMGKNMPYVWCEDSSTILFHFDLDHVKSEDRLKKKIYHYACDQGWEKADHILDMDYKKVLEYFNLKVLMKKPKNDEQVGK